MSYIYPESMPPLAERTYSFRGPSDLAARIAQAGVVLDQFADAADPAVSERIVAELALALARDPSRFHDARGNQSAFVRETVELLVGAVEKVASDLHHAEAYALAASTRSEEEAEFRRKSVV